MNIMNRLDYKCIQRTSHTAFKQYYHFVSPSEIIIFLNDAKLGSRVLLQEAIVTFQHLSACAIKSHPFILAYSLNLTLLCETKVPTKFFLPMMPN